MTLGLVASCSTDSLDSVVNLETETKIENLSISNKWEKLGVIYGTKGTYADSVVVGTTYNILYTDNNAIKVYYSEEKKGRCHET